MTDAKNLMLQIMQCEFVLIDINLFLDTHPNDSRALADYACYAEQLASLKQMYTDTYGPLSNFGNSLNRSDTEWLWNTRPFPWQSCNTEV